MLQAAELAAARGAPPAASGASGVAAFVKKVEGALQTVQGAENPENQARARALMPIAQWRKEAKEEAAFLADLGVHQDALSEQDLLALKLLSWFKKDFFKWVRPTCCDLQTEIELQTLHGEFHQPLMAPYLPLTNIHQVDPVRCDYCGGTSTRSEGMGQPSPEDLRHGAARVELHRCTACNMTTRFPRYNDVAKLLEPACRRG